MSAVTIRLLAHGEVDLLRELYLRALTEAPEAFAHTAAELRVRPEDWWAELAISVTEPAGHVAFIAEKDGGPLGLCFGLRKKNEPRVGGVGGMWVAPQARGQSIGRRLVEAVITWARAVGLERLRLWVTAGNNAAFRLYEAAGFRPTGRRDVLPSDRSFQIVEMARAI